MTLTLSLSVTAFGLNAQERGARGDASNAPPAGETRGAEDIGTAGAGGMGGTREASSPFERLDADKDGAISREEARNNNLYQQFSQADTDRDGRIDQAEYRAWTQTGTGAAGAGERERERAMEQEESERQLRIPPGQRPPRE